MKLHFDIKNSVPWNQ